MSNRITRAIEEVERAVAEIIKGIETSNLQLCREFYLAQLSSSIISLANWRAFIRRVSWRERLLETGTYDQCSMFVESRWVPLRSRASDSMQYLRYHSLALGSLDSTRHPPSLIRFTILGDRFS